MKGGAPIIVVGVAIMLIALDWAMDMLLRDGHDRGALYMFRAGAILALVGVAVAVVMAKEMGS